MLRKHKVIILTTIFILGLSSCTPNSKTKKITWYVASNSEWWIGNEEPSYESIKSEHIDAVNKRLEELEKTYRLEVKVFPSEHEESLSASQKEIETIMEKDPDVDIISYKSFWHNEFENLDAYMDLDNGKELRKQIPDNLYESIKVNSSVYMVPSLKYPVRQSAFVFLKEYYDTYKLDLEKNRNTPKDMLTFLNQNYNREKGYMLASDFGYMIPALMFQEYDQIDDTPLYIRKSDKKVVNPYEEKEFLDLYGILAEITLKGLTERNLSFDELEEIQKNNNYIFNFVDSYRLPEIIKNDEQRNDSRKIEIPLGTPSSSKVMGYGIMKDSKNKEEAFDLLAVIQTDATLSNALIYGPNPKIENEKVKSKGHFAAEYFSSLGNNVIALPATIEVANKKDLFFEADSLIDSSAYIPIRLIFDDFTQQIDKLNAVVNELQPAHIVDASSEYKHLNSKEAILDEIQKVNTQLKEAGIDVLIADLQKQIDGDRK